MVPTADPASTRVLLRMPSSAQRFDIKVCYMKRYDYHGYICSHHKYTVHNFVKKYSILKFLSVWYRTLQCNKRRNGYYFEKKRLMQSEVGTIAIFCFESYLLVSSLFCEPSLCRLPAYPLPWQVRCEFLRVFHGSYLPHHSPENVHSANVH